MAKRCHLKEGHTRWSCYWGGEVKGYLCIWKTETDIIMVASITPYTGTWYRHGHGVISLFKGLFRTAIPLLMQAVGAAPPGSARLQLSNTARAWSRAAGPGNVLTREIFSPDKVAVPAGQCLTRALTVQDVTSGLHAKTRHAMHQERTGPAECVALADRRDRWLLGADQPQIETWRQRAPEVPDPHQLQWLPGPQPLLSLPEVPARADGLMDHTSRPSRMLTRASLQYRPWTCCSTSCSDKWTWWWTMSWCRTALPGEGPDRFRCQLPTSPCGHQALHPSHSPKHSRCGCAVQWTNSHQGHNQPSEQYSLRQLLAKEHLQLCTHGTELSLPGGERVPATSPALAVGLWARRICWDLSCSAEVLWYVPQQLGQWLNSRQVQRQEYAAVLEPDAQRRCGLPIRQRSGHRESQLVIRQASSGNHHNHSLRPVQ